MSKTIVFYHFFEKDLSYVDNLAHFLTFSYRDDLDYVITLAGEISIDLPEAKNITYLKVSNQNYDFGGFAAALASGISLKKYRYFIFINCSVRGPFMPEYLDISQWTEPFINGLTEDVALFGPTICSPNSKHKYFDASKPTAHVQSYAYILDDQILEKLIEDGFYNVTDELTRDQVVKHYEIGLSQKVIAYGKNISCLMPEYQVDYRKQEEVVNPSAVDGDPYKAGQMFGRTAGPLETIFSKLNRGVTSAELHLLASSMFLANENLAFSDHPMMIDYRNRVATEVEKAISSAQAAKSARKPSRLRKLANRVLRSR